MSPLIKLRTQHSAGLLALLYTVGVFGLSSPYQPQFVALTPCMLLATAGILFGHHSPWDKHFIIFCSITWLISFLVEVVGVQTSLIFGAYRYVAHLGWKVAGVPLLIGLNWLILVYAVGNMLAPLFKSTLLKSLVGAALITALDIVMEPVAIHLGFWHWENAHIPIQN